MANINFRIFKSAATILNPGFNFVFVKVQIGTQCVRVKELNLAGLTDLVDDDLILAIARNMPLLESLDIKACQRVTDDAICSLALRCSHIRILVLAGLVALTDTSIFSLANHLQETLLEIYLSGCSRVSPVSIRYLADSCLGRLYVEHRLPNRDPNHLMAKNLDTGRFERVDLLSY